MTVDRLIFNVYGKPTEMDDLVRSVLNDIDSADRWTWDIDATAMQSDFDGTVLDWRGHVEASRLDVGADR